MEGGFDQCDFCKVEFRSGDKYLFTTTSPNGGGNTAGYLYCEACYAPMAATYEKIETDLENWLREHNADRLLSPLYLRNKESRTMKIWE
jgi:hypothetical protein